MKLRPRVCMLNISAPRAVPFLAVGLLIFFNSGAAFPDVTENVIKAAVDKFEQTSKPLFDPDAPEQKEKRKEDPFFDKIRQRQIRFEKKEQKRQRDFTDKLRGSDWSDEKRQQEIFEFNKGKIERRKKFSKKQQQKIDNHLKGKGKKGFIPWIKSS